jgi:zinc protease
VSTSIVGTQAQRPFLAVAPVQADKTSEAMQELKREIDQFLTAKRATEAEVATSKKRSTLTLPGRWETARAVARDISELVRYQLPDDYWTRYADLVGQLSVDEVNTAATGTLHPDQLTWVIVGDLSVIEPKVRELGFGAVSVIDVDGNSAANP